MDLDDAIAQVYAASPDEFVAVRTALVGRAREAGDRALGKDIAALRKPTKSAWLINLLARSAPDEVAGLLDLGSALREAQAALSGPELRRLSRERQQAVQALARRAGELAAEHDQRASEGQLQEVSQHLQAALADPDLAADVRAGRVTQIVTVGGFGLWEATAAVPPSEPSTPPTEDEATEAAAADQGLREEQLRAARRTEARDAWKRLQHELREAETAVREAVAAAEAAGVVAERLRAELANAEQAAAQADRHRTEAEQQLAQARDAAEEATRQIEGLLDEQPS